MKTYRATVWLMRHDNTIRKSIIESDEVDKGDFMVYAYKEMMLDHNPEEGWHLSFGPISEKPCIL